MSFFNRPFGNYYGDNDEFELSHDRVFGSSMMGYDYCLMFKRCRHTVTIPVVVIDMMRHRREIVEYLNKLTCPECEREFARMESELTRQYIKFMEGGGFKK